MSIRRVLSILIFVVFLFVLTPVALAATYTVNPGDSIQAAVNGAASGDTILVNGGVYYENVVVNKPLTLTGIGMPVVDGRHGVAAFNITAKGVVLQGFTATNASEGILINANNTTVTGNNASDNLAIGIDSAFGFSNNTITDNVVNNTRSLCGIYVAGSYNHDVSGNTVCNSGDNGIDCGLCMNCTISDNILNNNIGYGVYLANSHYNTLTGNTVNNNSYAGIYICYSSSNNMLTGNTVTLNGNDFNYHTGGIVLLNGCNYNRLSANYVCDNLYNGIRLEDTTVGNVFWLNVLADNPRNASEDYVPGSVNFWNSTAPLSYTYGGHAYVNYTGNYWGDYAGPDANGDGIGDEPYPVNGIYVDYYPMVRSAAGPSGPVRNLRSGETFAKIQDAIDDADTIAGDIIQVNSGLYKESVTVNKALVLQGVGMPIVDPGYNWAFYITADGVTLEGFNATNVSNGYGIGVYANHTSIIGNIVDRNQVGIYIIGSYCTVTGNTANNNQYQGIFLTGYINGAVENTVENNIALNNSHSNIYLYNASHNDISGNTANSSAGSGIQLLNSDNNDVANNMVGNNSYGIYLSNSNNSLVTMNWVLNNSNNGVYVFASCNNNIAGNSIIKNNIGINLDKSDPNYMTGNDVRYNPNIGITAFHSNNSVIWLNVIGMNGVNAFMTGGSSNKWNSTAPLSYTYYGTTFVNHTGNYWGDYVGPDANNDGIGDTPYDINPINYDNYPMLGASASAKTVPVALSQGWNLISVPVSGPSLMESDLLANASLNIGMIAVFDTASQSYITYSGSPLDADLPVSIDRGYFVYCTGPSILYVTGIVPAAHDMDIAPGWNMIGWSNESIVKAGDVLDRLDPHGQMVARFDDGSQNFITYVGSHLDVNFDVKPTEGYFVSSDSSTTLHIGGN